MRGLIAAVLGLLIAQIGIDPVVGAPRFTFGRLELLDGFGIVPVAMGLFGVGEILLNAETPRQQVIDVKMRQLDALEGRRQSLDRPIARGTVIGFFLGLIPGLGAMVPTFISYVGREEARRGRRSDSARA